MVNNTCMCHKEELQYICNKLHNKCIYNNKVHIKHTLWSAIILKEYK